MEKRDPDDPIAVYIGEVSNLASLTEDEETNLLQELHNKGNVDKTKVEARLIEGKLMLVVSVAQRYSEEGVSVLDLIQQGNISLASAVRRFAERPIGDFTTYATTCIEDAIRKALSKSK